MNTATIEYYNIDSTFQILRGIYHKTGIADGRIYKDDSDGDSQNGRRYTSPSTMKHQIWNGCYTSSSQLEQKAGE